MPRHHDRLAHGRYDGLPVTIKCSHCGAPLNATSDQTVVTCGYCHTSTRIASTRQTRRAAAGASAPQPTRMIGFAIAGVVITGAIAAFVAARSPQMDTPASPSPAGDPAARPLAIVAEQPQPIATHETAKPAPDDATPTDTGTAAPSGKKQKTTAGTTQRAPTGPILTKKDAEQVLRPELLACMKEHRVHYLITRLGNEPRGGTVPPLGITETSIVDYKPTPGFASTPLGRCVARAGSAVRAPAYGGNYIYFGLRHDSIPDPLADADARMNTAAATKTLTNLDDEARDCVRRSPSGSRPGESVRIMVLFHGATGKVASVEPYYVDTRSAYGRCITSVYRKATVDKFRAIDDKVLHILEP